MLQLMNYLIGGNAMEAPLTATRKFNLLAFAIFVALFATNLSVKPAHATLISKDLINLSDGLVTIDSITGNEWLDLTETEFFSLNQVSGSFVGVSGFQISGFQVATSQQVADLLINAGASALFFFTTPGSISFSAGDAVAAENFISLFGCTRTCGSNTVVSGGIHAQDSGSQAGHSDVTLLPNIDPQEGRFRNSDQAFTSAAGGQPGHGVFLFRGATADFVATEIVTSVPEPGALALFGIGLAGLGFMRRRRKMA